MTGSYRILSKPVWNNKSIFLFIDSVFVDSILVFVFVIIKSANCQNAVRYTISSPSNGKNQSNCGFSLKSCISLLWPLPGRPFDNVAIHCILYVIFSITDLK